MGKRPNESLQAKTSGYLQVARNVRWVVENYKIEGGDREIYCYDRNDQQQSNQCRPLRRMAS